MRNYSVGNPFKLSEKRINRKKYGEPVKVHGRRYAAFGRRLKNIRLALDFNGKDFATAMDISKSTLSGIENGTAGTSLEFLFKLQDRYRASIEYLFTGSGEMFTTAGHEIVEVKGGAGEPEAGASPPDTREKVEEIDTVEDLLWYFQRSTFVRHWVLAGAAQCLLQNRADIEEELKRSKK